jgi:hypothetical protein
MNHYGFMCLFAAFFSGNRRMQCRRRDDVGRWGGSGTLIHNGNCSPSQAISLLSVSLIKSCFESFSITEVCCALLFPAGFLTTLIAAVLMAPIASAANAKQRHAFVPSANSLAQNIFNDASHLHPKGRLDSSRRSCQLSNGCINIPHTHEVLPLGLGRWNDRGLFFSTFRMRDYTNLLGEFTPSARMMLGVLIPADVHINTFWDDR